MKANYKVIDIDKYYRKGVYQHFTDDCKCSLSITNKIDVTALQEYSKRTGTKFYINFLYCLGKVINSRDDYKMGYLWKENKVVVFDKMNITHYVFHEDTETCTPVYTEFSDDYKTFYNRCHNDIEAAKQTREYMLDEANHPNYFDASYISWISYESLNIELPDGYLYYQPVINFGRYKEENGLLMMPVTVRMNHAIADGYLVSKVFLLLEEEIKSLCYE
jgi:chloramphenicol O-acetyltransferase type A